MKQKVRWTMARDVNGDSKAGVTVWVALDVPTPEEADAWMTRLHPHHHFKVGLELFLAAGPRAVAAWTARGEHVFLDLKLHDIPHTVAGAVRQARRLGVDLLTVHAAGGPAMLAAAQDAAGPALTLAAVTVLTSLSNEVLTAMGAPPARAWVETLAAMAAEAGVGAAVTSGAEVMVLHRRWPTLALVVPGVRPAGTPVGDQARVVSPANAVAAGAAHLVVGRPVLTAGEPLAALAAIKSDAMGAMAHA
ncbi:MAG: orotidine-5'-phosphate decarboxylase [Thermaerobacter sp.]|nr:orotidine-5'-phosphate decarboxylase [Thermaerobacter sp.]